jgi:tripartite-type tricarboxylate transporter receptor subunit TctC
MKLFRRRQFLHLAVGAAALLVLTLVIATPAPAQNWPGRPIRLIVPYPAGGPADIMGRIAAQEIQQRLGATVIVENRAGASGTMGAETVRQAAPDGYTLLAAPNVHVLARHVLKSVSYDPVKDFTPIARYGAAPLLVLANPAAVAGKTIAEALPAIRANPQNFRFGLSALGATNHLAVLEFNRLTGQNLTIVPYRGSAPALADLLGGQVQLMIDPIVGALPNVRAGLLRALAVTSPKRTSAAPEIMTATESGLPGLEFSSWYGLWGPKGLPESIVSRLNAILSQALREPALLNRLNGLGFEPVSTSPEEFAHHIDREVARGAALLAAAKYELQ